MHFLSVCSGIEAASVAFQPLGWKAVAFSEIEPFPCSVLAHHYPETPNWGDMTKYEEWPNVSIDLLCGGTPCQSFSVAGLRKGLADPRGNLMLTFGAIAAKYRPKWLVWENVPGVLSSNGGRDFGAFLGMLGELGYGFAYRVLDAQYFGVAQRRRRVFVVGCLGDWRSAAAILFERHSLSGHPAPRRQTGQRPTGTLSARTEGGGGLGTDFDLAGGLQPVAYGGNKTSGSRDVASALSALSAHGGTGRNDFETETFIAHSLRGEGFDASEDGTGRGTPLVPVDCHGVMPTMLNGANTPGGHMVRSGHNKDAYIVPMAFAQNQRDEVRTMDVAGALAAKPGAKQQTYIAFPERMSGTQCASTENLAPSMGAFNPTAVAVALRGRDGGATAELGDEVGSALRASGGGGDKAHVTVKINARSVSNSVENKGFDKSRNFYASAQETNAIALLRRVREAIGTQAFAQWGLGILDSLQQTEILRSALHGSELRPAPFTRRWVVCCALGSPFSRSAGAMHSMREAAGERCSSQGWGFSEQHFDELGAYLSELSQPGAQAERLMRDLWQASEGVGVLRDALSAVQEARRSTGHQGQPVRSGSARGPAASTEDLQGAGLRGQIPREGVLQQACPAGGERDAGATAIDQERGGSGAMAVRRLTVEECEFLQGFSRGYTNVPHRGKPAADGPRYKALGNSWAVPCAAWIGRRISAVNAINQERKAA